MTDHTTDRITDRTAQTAIITGASRGLGLELTRALSAAGWHVVADARSGTVDLPGVTFLQGDVTDPAHRRQLVDAASTVDLLVNNAGALGPSPLPAVADLSVDALRAVLETNTLAPLALTQLALSKLRAAGGIVVNITSDAAAEAYQGWGGYGASKIALEQLGRVLGVEEEQVTVWQVDPGDMRTQMHQDAFPGEDISDRPLPEQSAARLVELIEKRPPSGRYQL